MTDRQLIEAVYVRYRDWALRDGGPVPMDSLERLIKRFGLLESDLPWLSCFKIAHAAYKEGMR